MSDLLWQKAGRRRSTRASSASSPATTWSLDRELFLHDIDASRAHVGGPRAHRHRSATTKPPALVRELDALADGLRAGRFVLDERYEDGHSAIEARLIERLGDAGRKVHTGRSRNDQVLVATRLWLQGDARPSCARPAATSAQRLPRARRQRARCRMPGYTHLQRAVVSSTALWFAGFAEAFIDDAQLRARHAGLDRRQSARHRRRLRRQPAARPRAHDAGARLRAPAGRRRSTRSCRAASSRSARSTRSAARCSTCAAWPGTCRLFTTAEFGFVALPAEYTTGSSIMPNKRNPDVVELLRASYASGRRRRAPRSSSCCRCRPATTATCSSPRARSCTASRRGLDALALLPDLLRAHAMERAERCAQRSSRRCTRPTWRSNWPRAGVPFREAYRQAAESAATAGQGRTPEASLAARVSPGAAAELRLEELRALLDAL